MLAKFSAAAVALAASSLVSAQTSTKCDPRKGSCPDDPAFGGTVECDFTKGACPAFRAQPGSKVEYTDKGAVFTIKDAGDGPTIISDRYLFHGKLEVELQAAPGQGIVSSVVLLSDDLDEIDFEWIGSKGSEVQSNYFSKGASAGYTRSVTHPIGDTLDAVRKYGIEWSNQSISWSVDGKEMRKLQAAAAQEGPSGFPQTPMFIKLGIWVGGGPESNKGTKEWAGGSVDFSQAPFTAVYKSIKIVDLGAQGSDKVYRYSDRSGNAGSITVGDAKGNKSGQGSNGGSSHNESADEPSSTDGPSATTSPSPKSSGIGETGDDGDKPQPGTNMTTGGSGSSVTSGPSSVPAGSAGSGASVPTAAAGSLSRRDFASFGVMVAATAAVVALLLP